MRNMRNFVKYIFLDIIYWGLVVDQLISFYFSIVLFSAVDKTTPIKWFKFRVQHDFNSNKNIISIFVVCLFVQELQHIRNSLPDGVKLQRVEERLSALGNVIACNDYVALVHPDLDRVSIFFCLKKHSKWSSTEILIHCNFYSLVYRKQKKSLQTHLKLKYSDKQSLIIRQLELIVV